VPLKFRAGRSLPVRLELRVRLRRGLRRRLEVAHTKLCGSRAFWLVAYPSQSHEMLFDAHARAFAAFGGVPRAGHLRQHEDRRGQGRRGKERTVNARFEAMTGHYLFEPEFCNVASGWEKGIVEKNVQDRRGSIWREGGERRWPRSWKRSTPGWPRSAARLGRRSTTPNGPR
jgi:transposase